MKTYTFILKNGEEILVDAENIAEAKILLVSILMEDGFINKEVKIQ